MNNGVETLKEDVLAAMPPAIYFCIALHVVGKAVLFADPGPPVCHEQAA